MLREINAEDLDVIRRWRNSPDVRSVMFSDHVIKKNEHINWWKNLKNDKTKKTLIFIDNGVDVGVVNYFDIDQMTGECHWGFYLSNDLTDQLLRLQVWQKLEKEAIEYAFTNIKCKQLLCESFYFNKPVIEMHKRFGFVEIEIEERIKSGETEKVSIARLTADEYYKHEVKNYVRLESKITFLGSSNLDFIEADFKQVSKEYNVDFEITSIPFAQYILHLNDPESLLCKAELDYYVFVERIEDFIKANEVFSVEVLPELSQRWSAYIELLRNARARLSGVFFVCNPSGLNSWVSSLSPDVQENIEINHVLDQMKRQLSELCKEVTDVHIIDLDDLVKQVGRDQAHPGKYWYMARSPFSTRFNKCFSQHLLGLILSLEAKTARVIVLDLDNTLWGGVIGDDGLNKIAIGGDYPGNVYQVIQRIFLSFQKRGIALVLCSKNTENIALEVFEKHPEMILNKKDFVVWRINWAPKPQNIKEIADELNLGLASFCFIDDNPVERKEVKERFAEVFVPNLPEDITEWPEYIINLPELSDLGVTAEDRNRNQQYKIRSQIKNAENQYSSREVFLKSLSMRLNIEPCNVENQQRVLQLIQKTNQFNTTTRRYKESELISILENGECFAVRLTDIMGSDEIIGVMVIIYKNDNAHIDSFLLSCRVLGRGIETAMLSWMCKHLNVRKVKKLYGVIIATERNQPVQELYKNHNFCELGDGMYMLDLSSTSIDLPDWMEIG